MAIYAQTPRWCLLDNKNAELSFPCDEDETEVPCLTGTTAAVIYFQLLDDRRNIFILQEEKFTEIHMIINHNYNHNNNLIEKKDDILYFIFY